MKNIVFIPYIKREKDLTGKSSIGHSNRHQGYEYGIKSWKYWCDKNSCELYVMSDLLCPESEMLITWQRWKFYVSMLIQWYTPTVLIFLK